MAKFAQYSMNYLHQNNRMKWQAYERLGFDTLSPQGRLLAAEDVIRQLRAALPSAEARAGKRSTPHDPRWDVRVVIRGPNGRSGTLHTAWQSPPGQPPRLVTNWVEVHREEGE